MLSSEAKVTQWPDHVLELLDHVLELLFFGDFSKKEICLVPTYGQILQAVGANYGLKDHISSSPPPFPTCPGCGRPPSSNIPHFP